MTNPFIPNPLTDWGLQIWYVNRCIEEQNLFGYLQSDSINENVSTEEIIESRNFIVMGQGGSGKTTLLNYIKNHFMPKYTEKENMNHTPIAVSATKDQDLRSLLSEVIKIYLEMKLEPTDDEKEFLQQITTPNRSKNIPLTTLQNFFTLTFDRNGNDNPIILIDNAHFMFEDPTFKGFIASKGFETRFYIGLFITPKAYYDLKSYDPDCVLDRFPKKIVIGKLTAEQTKEMAKKRLEFVNIKIEDFLSDRQLNMIHSSLNGMPRPLILAFRNLYEVFIQKQKIDDKDVALALIDVRLENLDYLMKDEDMTSILRVFMNNKGMASIKDLQDINLPKATLYLKLNAMEKDGIIARMVNEETGEIVRGKWALDQNMATIIFFGANGELSKPYEEQE